MPQSQYTRIRSRFIEDEAILRSKLNVSIAGQAVTARILEVAGTGVKIYGSSGVDSGTGDVSLTLDFTLLDARWVGVNDSRLTNARNAADVFPWAKASVKPTYAWSEIISRPTALSAFTNDLGNYGGFLTGSNNWIQNQNGSPQSAGLWVSNTVRSSSVIISGEGQGFQNSNYILATNNPIWAFSTAPSYGIGYLQNDAIGDAIQFYFGDISNPKHRFVGSGNVYHMGNITIAGLSGTGTRLVTADVSGVLSTSSSTGIIGDDYIKNQNASKQYGNLWISGVGKFGGELILDTPTPENRYHELNRYAITQEQGFMWRTNGLNKWFIGQRSFNAEDGFSFYSTASNSNVLYFFPSGNSLFTYAVNSQKQITSTSFDQSLARLQVNNTSSTGNRTFSLVGGIHGQSQDGFSIFDSYVNATRFVINNNGFAGFGTNNPIEALEVVGNIKTSGTAGQTATPDYIWLGNNYSSGTTRDKLKIYLYNSGTEQYGFSVGSNSDVQYHSNSRHDFYVANVNTFRVGTSVTASSLAGTGIRLITSDAGGTLGNSASGISPTFQSVNLTSGASVNKVWQCVNATTGEGQWAIMAATQTFISTWNASTNSPYLSDSVGTSGYYHNVTVAGTQNLGSGSITYEVGDSVIYNGSIWQKIPKPVISAYALSATNDTNVTITLGGSYSIALLNAASITVGWSGTLADGRIASASTWNAKESALTFSTGLSRTGNTIINTITNTNQLTNGSGFITSSGLTGYATQTWVNAQGFVTGSPWTTQGYITSSDLTGYATQSWVNLQGFVTGSPWTTQGYITSFALTGYATQAWVNSNFLPLSGGTLSGGLSGTTVTMSGLIKGSEVERGSSRALKTNIKSFDVNAIDYLNKIAVMSYNLKDGGLFGIGFIAEDTHWWLSGDQQKSHLFGNHLGVLTKAVQDEDKKVEELKKQMAELMAEIKLIQNAQQDARR